MHKRKLGFFILFILFILPICIFIFLKLFGKNEFAVPPLYQDEAPEIPGGCTQVSVPYHVPDSVLEKLDIGSDSLLLIVFGPLNTERTIQLKRVEEEYTNEPLKRVLLDDPEYEPWRKCIFFMKEPFDVVLVDREGVIRGQYVSGDLDEVDRLITEIAIILKKY